MSQPEVALRDATWAEARQVWSWNNAPDVRRASLDSEPIALEDHERWYRAKLGDAAYHIWIARADGDDVGVVRVEENRQGVGVVSIALDASARGRGLGRRALAGACRAYFQRRPGGALEAWIHDANEASLRCFERCGFARARTDLRGGRIFVMYRLQEEPTG
ncbi:MAG: GNAT family N-acetyltransferase [Nannocystaceae bacterium]|nr:GNAT family N-acetyltransferase [bacterium]